MSISALAALQRALQDFVLHGAVEVRQQVHGTMRVPASTRLAIYADAYRARLSEGLESNFPILAKLMGASEFQRLARRYIEGHESRHRSIRWYGDQLAQFLSEDATYRDAAVLADLATFEWTMTEAFDAADAQAMALEELSRRTPQEWADLQLRAHPSLRRVHLSWNAPQIWKAIQEGESPPQAQCESTPRCWLLWRQELQVFFRSADPVEAAAIEALQGRRTFGELCVELAERLGAAEAPRRAASLMRGWVESGMIVPTSPSSDKSRAREA
jgi:hypothetical protein